MRHDIVDSHPPTRTQPINHALSLSLSPSIVFLCWQQVLKAEIVNHPNTMPPDESGDADADEGTSKKCAIM